VGPSCNNRKYLKVAGRLEHPITDQEIGALESTGAAIAASSARHAPEPVG
jgi:hypothetical protein